MLAGSAIIFVGVSAALLVAWRRPRAFGPRPERPLILWGGLVMPVAVLTALVTAAFVLGERLLPGAGAGDPLRVEVAARQWTWTFRYPDGQETRDVLHIPAGRDVLFSVTSEDVIHSFWIPRLGGKIDAIPGHVNTIRLFADRPGRYGGICAEFCGDGHTVMRFGVVAHDPARFDAELAAADGAFPPVSP